MVDVFSGDAGEYDPTRFHLESTDSRGHSVTSRLKYPPDLGRRIGELIASQLTPYRTFHDYVRDSMVQRVIQIDHYNLISDPSFTSFARELSASAALDTQLEISKARDGMVETCRKLAYLTDDKVAARQAIERMIETLPPGRHKGELTALIQTLPS